MSQLTSNENKKNHQLDAVSVAGDTIRGVAVVGKNFENLVFEVPRMEDRALSRAWRWLMNSAS